METPRMLPKRAASKFCLGPWKRSPRISPMANEAVVITPITASLPSPRRRVTEPMAKADASPQAPAPRK